MSGEHCSSACTTKDHASYGECLRSKNIRTLYAASHKGLDYSAEKRDQKEISEYRAARAAGIQPASTRTADIRRAVAASEKAGKAFDAAKGGFK